jgi:hypothetical protein
LEAHTAKVAATKLQIIGGLTCLALPLIIRHSPNTTIERTPQEDIVMTSNILPIFWDLASSSKDTRIPRSAELISSLEGFQRSYIDGRADKEDSSEDEDDDEDDEEDEDSDAESGIEVDADDDMGETPQDGEAKALDKALDKENADDVVYAVKRLIRGLGSSRDSSRLGFAVALTEVRPSMSIFLLYHTKSNSFLRVYHRYHHPRLSRFYYDRPRHQRPTRVKRTEISSLRASSVLPPLSIPALYIPPIRASTTTESLPENSSTWAGRKVGSRRVLGSL